ncbi:MAG: sensor histidine kinase [Anaerolineaceae bacterium]|nr:sensor histidine kinase [Anaerolineaceae bacterium]
MKSENRLMRMITSPYFISYATIFAVGLLGMFVLESEIQRLIGLVLLVLFAVLFGISPKMESPNWQKHLYLIVQSVLVCGLMTMQPTWSVFPILFFILSSHAMMIFQQKIGYIWVGLFTLFTAIIFVVFEGSLEGFLSVLPFSAGYWFFAAFATTLTVAEQARKESQTLLVALQLAHQQLQEYAAQVEELAVSEERNRLSREMHDTLGHRLTVAAVTLEGAQRLIPVEPTRATGMVSTVREEVREALRELRRTVATLREPLQTDIALSHALPRLTEAFENATDLHVHLTCPEIEFDLPNTHRLTLYRAVQEALTNVQRYAQAKNVWINIEYEQNQIVLLIHDDGVGFAETDAKTGFGLRGLQERVLQLNGELDIVSKPGEGVKLRIALPITIEVKNE